MDKDFLQLMSDANGRKDSKTITFLEYLLHKYFDNKYQTTIKDSLFLLENYDRNILESIIEQSSL